VNQRAIDMVTVLRGQLAAVHGAHAMSIHATGLWVWVLVAAFDDEAVRNIAVDLGLNAPETRTSDEASWLRATSTRDNVCVEVYGQHIPTVPAGSAEGL
jgi:hypothetical protein